MFNFEIDEKSRVHRIPGISVTTQVYNSLRGCIGDGDQLLRQTLALLDGSDTIVLDKMFSKNRSLYYTIHGMTELVDGNGFICLEVADLRKTLEGAGLAYTGFGAATGEDKAVNAAANAVSGLPLRRYINGAQKVLVNINSSLDVTVEDIEAAMTIIWNAAHNDADILFGASFDDDLDDELRIAVIATRVLQENPGA